MPKLIIDNREVTVAEGTNVLEAAHALGIVIPHFCYHKALGAVGACRLCAMKFQDGPVKGIQMACMVPAQDGMVVSTTDTTASELRAHVIEWLMMNHPHDCPVCDEGGECQLQDMTIAGGHGKRRYQGLKRTFTNQELGPFIEQEMNRCITCYRCVRTYRDYCGGSDFGVFGSRNRVFFGRFREGRLESPFSGNLVDVCPTGVFTDKTFRFKSRYWDLQEAPSICPHCSLGCSTIPGGRYRELQRIRSGINPATNGFFICDRGRFGYGYANHPERPRNPLIDGRKVLMCDAIDAARQRVEATVSIHGPESVAFLGSARASLEANALLRDWAERTGANYLLYEAHRERDWASRVLADRLAGHARSLEDVRQSDLLILVGADPLAEGPVLLLALRQAVRKGARVIVIDPRPVTLPCQASYLPLPPRLLATALSALADGMYEAFDIQQKSLLDDIRNSLFQAERPILIGGVDLLGVSGIQALLDTAEQQSTPERQAGVMALLPGPNSFGGALLSNHDGDFEMLLDDLQEGAVKALVCLEADPFREARDPAKAQAALGRLDQLVTIDATPTLAAQRADIFLPSQVTAEMAGSYLNNEGRLQTFLPVMNPGLPIRVTGQGDHPPRQFFEVTPGSAPEPAWWILAKVLGIEPDLAQIRERIAESDARFATLPRISSEGTPDRVINTVSAVSTPPADNHQTLAEGSLPLLPITAFIGSERLAYLSEPLEPLHPQPTVWLHSDQATTLGLADGDRARLTTHLGHCHVTVHVTKHMAPGLVLTTQLWNTALEGMSPGVTLECRLDKEVSA